MIVVDDANRLILMNPTARTALAVNNIDIAGRDCQEVIRNQEVRELFNGSTTREVLSATPCRPIL